MRKWWRTGWKLADHFPRVRAWSRSVRIRHINLFFAMVFSLVGAAAIAIFAAWVLAPLLNVGTQPTPPADLTRLALTVAAGVGGVVALVVAYRRQRDLEQSRFVEAFGAAAKQLGDADVAVRLAGVYAMAGVADQVSRLKRQQCIDVLCGYLRLPYSPELGNNHQSALLVRKPVLRKGGSEQELQFQYRQNDKVVRQTIVRVIAAHLQPKAPHPWTFNNFDFTASHFEQANFSGVTFSGEVTSFEGATFSGEVTSFEGVTFSGEVTSFEGATFSGNSTRFVGVTFSGGGTSFEGVTFSGGGTSFEGATFSGGGTSFEGATFSGGGTSFEGATFSGGGTSFEGVIFSGESTWFVGATFSGEITSFEATTFSSEVTSFYEATFTSEVTSFYIANFSGGATSFDGVTFSGREGVTFSEANFGDGRVTFEQPRAWSPAPLFDWDEEKDAVLLKPGNVEPQNWPPHVAKEKL